MSNTNEVKNLFCKTYDVGENEVKVLNCTDKTFSVEIQHEKFNYTYSIENNIIRFKPAD